MKQLNNILILLTLLGFNLSFGQSKKVKTLVEQIAKINEVQYQYIYDGGSESDNFKNFLQLKEIATTEELVKLTDDENATVACYASWALADNLYPDLKSIFLKFILKDRLVHTFNGCNKSQDNISEVLYFRYCNNTNIRNRPKDKILIELDSIIIFSKNVYWLLLNRALENRIYLEPYKTQISNIAFEENRKEAIFYLCLWHRAEYANKIKIALLKYLNETDFKNSGNTSYYTSVEELLKFKDPDIREAIIIKLKKDRSWEKDTKKFVYLFNEYSIYI